MAKYTSGRQKNLKVGLSSYSENLTSLEVIGKVGIGTTNATSSLYVVGDEYVTGVITATTFYGTFNGNSSTATYANNAGVATYATSAGIATYAVNAGIATYATNAGIATYATSSGIATYATSSGIATYATSAGIATEATRLQNARTFEITGDIVGAAVTFDGTGNVSIAATIQPNSVALGSDTTGDYVQSISGTANQIAVTGGTGETSTPVISIPSNPTLPGNVTIANDLQVNNNLNVTGNITIGGTSAYVLVDSFRVSDADIILGFTTDSSNQDVSNDTTANHGGIAVASTEGNPLVNLNIAGIETLPPTYKKIMWFKAGAFTGLNTDAWLFNYGVGIGSTQVPNGVRLAVGGVHVTDDTVTATTFSGNASSANYATSSGIATYATSSGIATYATDAGIATYATNAGIATYADNAGISTYADNAGISTSVIGGIGSITQLQVSGISTFTNGPVLIGNGTSTGTASQRLQVSGGVHVSGSVGIGTTNPDKLLHLSTSLATPLIIQRTSAANAAVEYRNTASSMWAGLVSNASGWGVGSVENVGSAAQILVTRTGGELLVGTSTATGTSSQLLQVSAGTYVSGSVGIGTTNPTSKLWVNGDGYFVGVVSASNFYVGGNVIGGGSISGDSIVGTALSISGISTLGTVQISSGIITAKSGVVTYYGDGRFLQGVVGFAVSLQDPVSTPVYPMFANNTGVTTAGISTTQLVFIPSSGNLGVGSTQPSSKLTVQGDVFVSGVVTATTFYGSAAGLTDIPPAPGQINITDITTPGTYYPTFTVGAGYTAGLNVTTTKFTFNPSTSVLTVKGTPYFGDTISSITLTNPLSVFTSNVNGYSQVQVQNLFAGGSSSASADFVSTTDSGTDTAEYIDMGINNSGFAAAGLWNAKDGYLYVQAPTSGNGGNLVVGTSGASGKDIIFHTGGTATTNERMRVSDTKVTIQDNVEVISGSIYGKVLAATYGMFMP